jgi:hypothetical protein
MACPATLQRVLPYASIVLLTKVRAVALAAAMLPIGCTTEPAPSPTAIGPGPTPTPVLLTPGSPTDSTLQPGPSGTPSEPAEPTPTPSSPAGIAWQLVPAEDAFSAFDTISDVSPFAAGLVAVGSFDDGSLAGGAASWLSADGMAWQRSARLPNARQAVLESVTSGPAGLLAVGFTVLRGLVAPAVWTSGDGSLWERVQDGDLARGQMSVVAANPGGYLALGFDPDTRQALAWASLDGRDWSAGQPVPAFGEQPSINQLVATRDGFLACGFTAIDERAAMWSSADGREWQLVAAFPRRANSTVNAVAGSGATLVAVGTSYDDEGSRALAWSSNDGVAWQEVGDHPALEDGEMLSVIELGTGFLAVGSQGGAGHGAFRAAAWSSPDGLSWQLEPGDQSFDLARMSNLVRSESQIIAIGEMSHDPAGEIVNPQVWLASLR